VVTTYSGQSVAANRFPRGVLRCRLSLAAICGVGIVLAALLAAGCAATPTAPKAPRIPPLQTPAPTAIPVGDGAVVGGIDICGGVIPKVHPRFVAGTVRVYRGALSTKPGSSPGSFQYVLPGAQIAEEKVKVNQEFRFFLTPGKHVLDVEAPWDPVSIVVRAGAVSTRDVPGSCL
jgi:hypothetical protein